MLDLRCGTSEQFKTIVLKLAGSCDITYFRKRVTCFRAISFYWGCISFAFLTPSKSFMLWYHPTY